MNALRMLLHMIIKEFLQLRQDRRMIPVIFVAPVIQIVIFGFAVNTEVANVPLVLVDLDHTVSSRKLAERFVRSGYFDLVAVVDETEGLDEWLIRGDAQVALVIGNGYGEALHGGRVPQVQLIADGSDASATTVALGYSAAILNTQSAEVLAARLQGLVAAASSGAAGPGTGRIEVVPRVFYNPDLRSRWFYVPAVLAMVLMVMTMMLSAMGVVREKEIGTMEQIIVTPIRTWQLILGKLVPFALIGLVQVFLVTAVTVWGFGVPLRGSFVLLVLLTQIFLLNTLGLGLLLSTLVRTQQQAMMTAGFGVMMPMLYLSGIIFPIENMPAFIQTITYAIPLRYYAVIIRGIFLKGSGLAVLWPQALALLLLGSGILALAVLRFRKRLD
jgi:ABC-2 type transport system permease protein